ncbi:MAG: OsmC family protein [Magnetospirillum sp.]|nr:OsmC family protein [Magnetospirillum sp.]
MFRATVENHGDSRYVATTGTSAFVIDTQGRGPHPLEALLASQAACIAHHVVAWLRDQGMDNPGFTIAASAELNGDKSRIGAMAITAGLDRLVPDAVQRAQLHAFVQRCPIYRTLSDACPVTLSFQE